MLFENRNTMEIDYLELQHYKTFVTSTQQLNEALNNQLSVCYDKINQLFRELEFSHNQNIQSQNQIQHLKDVMRQLERTNSNYQLVQKTDRIVYQKLNQDNNDNPQIMVNLKINNRTQSFNQQNEIEKFKQQQSETYYLKQQINQKQIEQQHSIEQPTCEISVLVHQITFLKQNLLQAHEIITQSNKKLQQLQFQIRNWQQKCQGIQSFRIQNIYQMLTQKQALLYQIAKRDESIVELTQKMGYYQNRQQTLNYQQSQIQYLRSSLANIMAQQNYYKKQKYNNQHLKTQINQLNEQINQLQTQNNHLKNQQTLNQDQQKAHRTTFLEIQLKMVKQQYTQSVKQNILLIESNSKLEKKRIELSKQLEFIKKQKLDIQHLFDQLSIQNQHNSQLLLKKIQIIQDMNNKMTMIQNQNHHLKTTATLDLISKLQKSLNSPYSNRSQRGLVFAENTRKNNFKIPKDDQVPVRDLSRSNPKLIKSKSTLIGINFQRN